MNERSFTSFFSNVSKLLVSVIMPVKNARKTVVDAVNSILTQTLSNFELLIIDDHSTDDSIQIINQIEDARIKLVANAGTGIAPALNTGLRVAKGNYIARMDADDISFQARLQKQVTFLDINPQIDVVSCLVENYSLNEGSQDGYAHHIRWLNSIVSPKRALCKSFC